MSEAGAPPYPAHHRPGSHALLPVRFNTAPGVTFGKFDKPERHIGIVKECWLLQQMSQGDILIGYVESHDFAKTLGLFAESRDELDLWLKRRMAEATGVDLNNPPQGPLSEQLSSYSA
jgi:hypothetical protein